MGSRRERYGAKDDRGREIGTDIYRDYDDYDRRENREG
jgi:hypothetical protein